MPAQEALAQPQQTSAPQAYGRRGADTPQQSGQPAAATTRTCLLVDDSRMIRKVGRKIVAKQGYEVSEAENGQEALAKVRLAVPDLIILDWDMPVMTGIEFLAALRSENLPKRPKVVFCTTHSSAQDIHKAIDLGADEFCTKPFNEQSLLGKLGNIGAA